MSKIKSLLIATAALFLLVNTSYFWSSLIGLFLIYIYLVLGIGFIYLVFSVFGQVITLLKEKLKFRLRMYLTSVMILLLILIYFYPFGIINFYKFEGEDKLTAYQRGVANGTTTLKLRANNKFILRSFFILVNDESGKYVLKGDTIKFDYIFNVLRYERFKFGVLDTASKTIYMYRSVNDKQPYPMHVIKNNLKF
jgi:hypothetical protein